MKRLALYFLVGIMALTCVLAACENESATNTSSLVIDESSITSTEENFSSDSESLIESSTDVSIEESVEESIEESSEIEESLPSDESENEESKPEESKPDENEPDESEPEKEVQRVKVLFSRYTQKPIFVMIGTCEQGASITAEYNGQKVTVPSYMGWFELSLENKNLSDIVDITVYQTINGKKLDPQNIKARPSEPSYLGTRAIGSNGAFQFFLEQMVKDYEGTNLFSESVLNTMKNRVSSRIDQLHQYNKNAEIIYMIVPSPMTTYPELVPERYVKTNGITAFDQITGKLKEAGATVIDLRDTFKEHKNDEMPLYYKLDSHWADYGAYLAYVELFEHISKKFPDAGPRDIDDFTWTADYYTSADACLYLGIPQVQVKEYGYYREFDFDDPSNITSVPRYRGMQLIYNDLTTEEKVFTTNRSNLPSCIVYRDSYSAGIYDLIPERMNKTHYIGMWNYAWQNWTINSEKPDYVIYIVAEWNAFQIVNN